jgi:hypothetical protein
MNDNNIEEVGKGIMSVFVRFVGLFLLLAGVYVALHVMLKAMELYEKPQTIERFAQAIEKGSNIDKSLSSFRDAVISEPAAESEGEDLSNPGTQQATRGTTEAADSQIRISYFFAWIIMLMLLMLIGSISLRAIKTGGELVLYDMQIKQFAKMLVKESSKARQ